MNGRRFLLQSSVGWVFFWRRGRASESAPAESASGSLRKVAAADAIRAGDDALRATQVAPENPPTREFAQNALGAVDRTLQDKLREIVTVQDFGAKGDGMADDTAAIQAAVAYATNVALGVGGPPSVMFTAGVYKVTSTIVLLRNISILGSGFPIIRAHHNGDVFHAIGIPSAGIFPDNKVRFEALSFKSAPGFSPASFIRLGDAGGKSPTYVEAVADAAVSNCFFQGCQATYLIDNNRGFGLTVTGCVVTAVTSRAALKLRQSSQELPYWTYAVNVFSTDFTNITGKAIEADGGDLTVFGGIFEGCSAGAVEIGMNSDYKGSQPVSFHGTYFEANQKFHFKSSNGRCTAGFFGCKFVSGGYSGNRLEFVSGNIASFHNCSSPNGAPKITGGNIRQYGCTYMASGVELVDSFVSDRSLIYSANPNLPAQFGALLNVNGSQGGGCALIVCSHSNGAGASCVSEFFFVRLGVGNNRFEAQSIKRIEGGDKTTFSFAVDAQGRLQVSSSEPGHAKYDVVYNTNGLYMPP